MASNRGHVLTFGTTLVLSLVTPVVAGGAQFREPVRAPDVFGGWASTHVIVRVMPGVTAGRLADGRLSLLGRAGAHDAAVEDAIADLLESWEVTAIGPTADPAPKNEELARELGLDRYYTVHVPAGSETPALVEALSAFETYAEVVELDGVGGTLQTFPNDTYFGNQYALHNTGQNIQGQTGIPDADIDAPEAWDLHTGTDEIILAIIDTGASESHPDLAAKLIPGRNIYDNNDDTDDSWFLSHGTHCSGIAAAISNNNQGVAGVSWGALIMPIKVLNWLGSGTETQCANGVIWAADHGANVGSMSLGYPDGISYFENAINYAHAEGMVLSASTGNTPGASIFFPARWANTIAVGATDNRDDLASFTTTGAQMSVAAPGVSVYSCIDDLFNGFDTYTYMDGTSMACPHVAGLACLVWSANPSLSNDEVRAIIESTADDKGSPGWDPYFGYGRINAHTAVSAAIEPEVEGDVDGDGDVDLNDLAALLAAYDTCSGDPGYDPAADFDESGCIDLSDLSALLANYGYGT